MPMKRGPLAKLPVSLFSFRLHWRAYPISQGLAALKVVKSHLPSAAERKSPPETATSRHICVGDADGEAVCSTG